MHALLTIFVLAAPTAALAVRSRRGPEETFGPVCCAFVLLLYAFGLTGRLAAGVWTAMAGAALCAAWLVWRCVRGGIKTLRGLVTPGALALAALYAWAWVAERGRMYGAADEFSHWGLVVKNMCLLDDFGTAPLSTVIFRGYPPGTALFAYFLCKLGGGYSEGYALRAMALLLFSLLLPLAKLALARWQPAARGARAAAFLAAAGLMLALPLVFYSGAYTEMYVDAALGVLMAYVLCMGLVSPRMDGFALCALALAGGVLGIVKASGLSLAAIAALVLLARHRRPQSVPAAGRASGGGLRGLAVRLGPALCCAGGALLTNRLWTLHLALTGTAAAWNTDGVRAAGLLALANGTAPAYRYAVLAAFWPALGQRTLAAGWAQGSTLMWTLVLCAVFGAALLCTPGPQRRCVRTAWAGLLLGEAAYFGALLVLYLFTYTQYEALALASFARYAGTYLLAMALTAAVLLLHGVALRVQETAAAGSLNSAETPAKASKDGMEKAETPAGSNLESVPPAPAGARGMLRAWLPASAAAVLCAFALLCLPAGLAASLSVRCAQSAQATATQRETFVPVARMQYLTQDAQRDRVYVISQNSVGLDYNIIRYMLTPVPAMHGGDAWSLGAPYSTADVWTKDLTSDQWRALLRKDYTYVYLYGIDDAFIARYGGAFEETQHLRSHTCWQVVPAGEDSCTLRFVDLNGLEQAALVAQGQG